MLQEAISLSTREEIDVQRERVRLLGQRLLFTRWLYFAKDVEASAERHELFEDEERLNYLAAHCIPDSRAEAERFLRKLDPKGLFTFQTFDDDAKRKDKTLVRVLNGTLDQHWDKLCRLNREGAGVYITVNETDGSGRRKENVTRARALFVDLDGAPLEPVMQSTPEPHIIVESSPKRFHCYWLVKDIKLEQFESLQKALAERFGGDPAVCDLPRVLRLPGCYHHKAEPYRSHIFRLRHSVPPYKVADFDWPDVVKGDDGDDSDVANYFVNFRASLEEVERALDAIPNDDKVDRKQWVDIGHALKSAYPGDDGLELFKDWSAKWTGGKYNKKHTVDAWKSFKPERTGIGKIIKLAEEVRKAQAKVAPSKSRLIIVRASDVAPEELHWIWPGHLLRGSQELMTGLPGLGKSQVQCHLVACCTACLQWPDGSVALDEPVNVIMLTAEDSIAQGLVPRLIAAGADTKHVHIVKCIHRDNKDRQFLLGEDLHDLEMTIQDIGNVGLITIDPITAYMGGKMDSHKTTEVRSQLGPLKDFAERLDVAISTITHPAKNAGPRAIDHFIGSQAFIAAGRVGHGCFQEMESNELTDKKPTGRMLFAHVKHSMSMKMPTLAYRLVADKEIAEGITPSRVVWDGEVDIDADAAIAGVKIKPGSINTDEQKRAARFLLDILVKGPRYQAYVEEEADQRGISKKVLRTVKDRIKVVSEKEGFGGKVKWRLPSSITVSK